MPKIPNSHAQVLTKALIYTVKINSSRSSYPTNCLTCQDISAWLKPNWLSHWSWKEKKKKFSISNLSANKVSHVTNSCSLGKLSYAHALTQNQSNLIKHLNFLVQNIVHSWGVLRSFNNKLIQNQTIQSARGCNCKSKSCHCAGWEVFSHFFTCLVPSCNAFKVNLSNF